LLQQPNTLQHSKAEGFYCIPDPAAEQQTDSGSILTYGRARLGPEECGEQCLAQITSRLAQPWPENSEEAVKENLNTEYQVIKQLQLNVTGASTTH